MKDKYCLQQCQKEYQIQIMYFSSVFLLQTPVYGYYSSYY